MSHVHTHIVSHTDVSTTDSGVLRRRVQVNYTTARSPNPDLLVTSTNCALGQELKKLYEHDQEGQLERNQLTWARNNLSQAQVGLQLLQRTLDGISVLTPPANPPPPPPNPPPAGGAYPPAPPSDPATVTNAERLRYYENRVEALQLEVKTRAAAISACIPSETQTCGRSSVLAPNPWLSRDGRECMGYSTYEALEGAYCGFWSSQVNVLAAESEEAAELLTPDGAPYCFSNTGTVLKCTVQADRTNRAGVYELQEWLRPDRDYCASDIFKQLILDNATTSEAVCRQTILERIGTCKTELCPPCQSPCLYPVARTIASTFRCMEAKRHLGFLYFVHSTDAGQLARSMHGAIRKDNYIAVPEKLAKHLWYIGHYNPTGLVQRDSISCRREHRSQQTAEFVPGFGTDGNPVSRAGYMVSCATHSDCLPCGRHPLTGQHYRCQKIHVLYDTVITGEKIGDNGIVFVNLTSGSSNAFDPDMAVAALTNKTGICVDIDSSMNEGCPLEQVATVKDALVGCMDDFAAKFLCGLSVEIRHGDISTVNIQGEPFWPRVLLDGSQDRDGDGVADQHMVCNDPIDCTQKCRYLERTSRHGMGAPTTCSMCNQYCPSNILTTLTELQAAVWDDILTIVRLVGLCFGNLGLAGCICQFTMTLQPEWRKVSTNEDVRCESGDPFHMIVKFIDREIVRNIEKGVNNLLIDPTNENIIGTINDVIDKIPIPNFKKIGDFFSNPQQFFDRQIKEAKTKAVMERTRKKVTEFQGSVGDVGRRLQEHSAEGDAARAAMDAIYELIGSEPHDEYTAHVYNNTVFGRRLRHVDDHTHSDNNGLPLLPSIPRLCIQDFKTLTFKCSKVDGEAKKVFDKCEKVELAGGLDALCYYQRVYEICARDEWIKSYTGLFDKGFENASSLNKEFEGAFGDSYKYLDPTLHSIVQQAAASAQTAPDLTDRKDICSSESFASSMTLDKIIISCVFRMFETWCPTDAAEDADFAFALETASFRLPKVRFSYDVSPPPPPPATLSVYQTLANDDPEGFIEMRRRLENWFPKLSHVATSSMGAAVGKYLPDGVVTANQLTKAYLASAYMTPNSLGARVVESKHTGRWRAACKMMHDYFAETTSPGRNGPSYGAGYDSHAPTHTPGRYDRNPLVYAMLEIHLSMNGHALDGAAYSTLRLHNRICGSGDTLFATDRTRSAHVGPAGHRVPVPLEKRVVNEINPVVEVTEFAPLINFGSLHMLRSMYMTRLPECEESGFYAEDGLVDQACHNSELASMKLELLERAKHAPHNIQTNTWCHPGVELSIESAVGNPFYFDAGLTDTSVRIVENINDLRVEATMRGEEKLDAAHRTRNLMSWVYLTSSDDPHIRAGMYRLLDLPLFRRTPCGQLPNAPCNKNGLRVNTELPLLHVASLEITYKAFLTGREALPHHRCSEMVREGMSTNPALRVDCNEKPYSGFRGQCSVDDLELLSRPTTYGSHHFLPRLAVVASPSPPPPPPAPSPPPSPAPPNPPPSPPAVISQSQLMGQVRVMEERVCTSVYYLSQATRCERLAQDLAGRIYYSKLSPPSAPPLLPMEPPPPPSPPRPGLPEGMVSRAPEEVLLSTYRVPSYEATKPLFDGYYTRSTILGTTLRSVAVAKRACVPGAPLACATGNTPTRCIGGARHCRTAATNAHDPYAHIYWKPVPRQYLWGFRFVLPSTEQLARLVVGKKRLELFGERDEPLTCAEGNVEVFDLPEDKHVLEVKCAPADWTAADLHAMARVRHAKLTLLGEYRQIWFQSIEIIERTFIGAGIKDAPSPPPEPPPAPPSTPAPAGAAAYVCGFDANSYFTAAGEARVAHRSYDESCGLTRAQCCDKLGELSASYGAFEIDDAGCCVLVAFVAGTDYTGLRLGVGNVAQDASRAGYSTADAGIGSVNVLGG